MGADATSTGDGFSASYLPGPASTNAASEGAGLDVASSDCVSSTSTGTNTRAIDLVAVDNSIGSPTGGTSEGAGIHVGCGSGGQYALSLIDSTVSGNQAPGGVAAVSGEGNDRISLANTIATGDSGAKEIDGFDSAGGSLSSSYSDLCQSGSSNEPEPGPGNICADPRLVGPVAGGPFAPFDAHETASSPTIDAGSNSLVPSGITADYFGNPRVVPRPSGCGPTPPAVVDIGAAEFQSSAPACPPPGSPYMPSASTSSPTIISVSIAHVRTRPDGTIVVSVTSGGPGTLSAVGTVTVARTAAATGLGRRKVGTLVPMVYGRTRAASAGKRAMTLYLRPTRSALRLLKRKRQLRVAVKLTFSPSVGQPTSRARVVHVRYHPSRKSSGR
jgi:hypothetical protein